MTDFLWQPLSGYSLSTVNEWLRTGVFPDGLSTPAVVAGLSKGEFGTKDRDIIEREICPESGSYVVIEVDWPDDQDPTDTVTLINREIQRTAHHERQNIQVIRS